MSAQPEALPVAWVNASNLSSAAISRQRGGPFDKYTWSEQRTDYHDTPLCAAAELRRLIALNAQMLEQRDIAIDMLARWCVAVDTNGTGWDDWDEHYKDAAYRVGPLREHAAAVAAPLVEALQMLYDDTADYIKLNNLGGMDNQCMRLARAALAAYKEPTK